MGSLYLLIPHIRNLRIRRILADDARMGVGGSGGSRGGIAWRGWWMRRWFEKTFGELAGCRRELT
jgi:hypothetical protein